LSLSEKLKDYDERAEILKRLKLDELKELARRNRIKLEKEDWLGRTKPATTKADIISILIESRFRESDLVKILGLSRLTKVEILNYMNVRQLRGLAREYGIPLEKETFFGTKRATSKDDMISILMGLSISKIRRYSEKISLISGKVEEKREKCQKRRETKVKGEKIEEKIIEREISGKVLEFKEVTVKSIIQEIKKYRPPPVKGRRIEEKLTIGLISFLQSSFPDIELEQPIAKGARIDAIIGGKIGIEAKYRPQATEFDRLYGQVEKYLRRLDHVIVVFFETPSRDVHNFRNRINKIFADKVTILNIV